MRWSRKNGLRFDKIFTMTVGRDGRLWFGHQIGGLGYIDSTGTPRYITEGEGLINGDTWALAVDDRGRVWASTRAGIGCYNHGVWSTITTQLGLPSSYIWPILPLGDSLFIGTQGMGLAVFNFGELRDRAPVVRFGESLVRRNETIVRWSAASYWGTIPPDRILTRHRVDAEPWSEWSLTREVTLQASSGWGNRRVEVQAKGLLGEVTEPPAAETVELPPPLVLRPYVLIPVGSMAALLAIGGFVAYRRKRRYDHELRVREQRYRVVVEQTGQIVYDYDIASGAIFWSGAIRDVTGYRPEEFAAVDIRTWEEMIHPEDRTHVLEELERSQKSVGRFQMEYRFRHKHGHYIDVADNGLFIPDGTGNAHRMLGAMNDISARKLAQEQIKESLREKEVLLKEIHHRVKNNLQVVSSLLNLQASTMTDPRAVEQLRESQHRIRTMALIHERLYQSQNLARIDFAEYLRSLVGYLSRSYNTGNVRLDIVTESVKLDVNLAIPCGLIVNELVSNALKHAFPDGRAGIVEVSLELTPERQCRIRVGDNGIGMPAEVNVAESKSLGLQLIHALIQQINATFEVERSAGTRITITFNPDLPA
jgi:PAS domain S-box-containing protein